MVETWEQLVYILYTWCMLVCTVSCNEVECASSWPICVSNNSHKWHTHVTINTGLQTRFSIKLDNWLKCFPSKWHSTSTCSSGVWVVNKIAHMHYTFYKRLVYETSWSHRCFMCKVVLYPSIFPRCSHSYSHRRKRKTNWYNLHVWIVVSLAPWHDTPSLTQMHTSPTPIHNCITVVTSHNILTRSASILICAPPL